MNRNIWIGLAMSGLGRSHYQNFLISSLALFFSCSYFLEIVHAQSTPPITSSGLNTQVSGPINLPSGETQYNITGGTRPENGANLFHSFGEFGLPENNIGNFQNDSGLATSNILGRVTGGNPSNIFGTIQTEGFPGANLFLMNPAGWVFGPNAALNVEGSVNFTTADYLRHSDGSIFMALSTDQDSQLSIAPIAAFGFLEGQPGTIMVEGSTLTVDQSQTISLVSGDISIEGAMNTPDGENPVGSNINAPGGAVLLASVASAGEILVDTLDQAPNIHGQSFGALGTVQVLEKSVIDVSGDGGGTVRIRGGRFVIDDSTISANTTGPAEGPLVGQPGEGIDIQVSQDVVIRDAAVLETNVSENVASGIGSGGVRVKADRIEILETEPNFDFPFTGIRSNVDFGSAGGPSGDVLLEANSILVRAFGFNTGIETITLGAGSHAGDIILRTTGDIDIDNGVLVSTSAGGGGNTGNIELTSTQGNIFIRDTSDFFGIGPFVSSQTQNSSTGKTGNITVNASQGDILLADNAVLFTRVSGSGVIAGSGGIELVAKNLTMNKFSGIEVDNFLPLVPGDITVNVSGRLSLSGNSAIQTTTRGPARSSDLNITARDILLTEGSFLSTETFGSGDAGTLNMFVENLQVTDGAQLRSSSTILSRVRPGQLPVIPSGSGGTINIQGLEGPATSVEIEGAGSGILTDTQGTGNGGNINILAENLLLTNGAQLRSSTSIGFSLPGQQPFIPTGSGGTINIGLASPAASVVI
jgi:filamentous hemagglutinin family protein